METLQDELLKDLKIVLAEELHTDSDVAILSLKIKKAVLEVKSRRNYQKHHDKVFIDEDMQKFYSAIYDLVLYDWNTIGAEGQSGHSENGISRTYVEREKYLAGIAPFVTVF